MDSLSASCIIELDVASVTVSSRVIWISVLRASAVVRGCPDCYAGFTWLLVARALPCWMSRASSGWQPDYFVCVARLTRFIKWINALCIHTLYASQDTLLSRARLTSFVQPLSQLRAQANASCIQFKTRQGNFWSLHKEVVLILI